jgi:hypothetical protein
MVNLVPYNSASAGTATIPQNLTTDIGADILFGQVGVGPLTVVAGSGVTVTGPCTLTYGPNHVLIAVQTALNVWTVSTYSWNLSQFLGNPNAQPLLVSYGQITFTNQSAAVVTVDTNPAVVAGGSGVPLSAAGTAGASYTKYYGNGPADVWYGVVGTATAAISVVTGAPTAG